MGLFSSIRKLSKKVVRRVIPKPIKRLIPKPAKQLALGLTKLNPKQVLGYAKYGFVLGPINYATKTLTPKLAPYVQLASEAAVAAFGGGPTSAFTKGLNLSSGGAMAFNLGGFLGSVGGILSNTKIGGLQSAGQFASLASQFVPQRAAQPAMTRRPSLPGQPKVPLMGAAGRAIGRGFFQKYPNLATAIQRFRNAGMTQVTRSRLYSLVRRFGPELIISGGILTAAAVSELMVAGPGRRRMNPANVHALRRSVRRIEGFHKLCMHVDRLRRPRSRKGVRVGSGSTFVRQG